MTLRATTRPAHVKPPAHWPPATPAPTPEPVTLPPEAGRQGPDPVRYGDWESKGIAIDF